MKPKKIAVILMGCTPTHDEAPCSRAIHIFEELKKEFPDTYLLMKSDVSNIISHKGIIVVKPVVPLIGKCRLLKEMFFRLQMSIFIIKFIKSNNIDAVFLRGYDCILLYPFLKILDVNIFFDFHGLVFQEHYEQKKRRALFTKFLEQKLLKWSDWIIVISDGVKKQITQYKYKCLYLPNGVDLNKIKYSDCDIDVNIPPQNKIIGFIGNWEHVMRMEDICESIKYLDNTTVLIIGRGYNAKDLMSKYENNSNIFFTGRLKQNDAYSLLNKMDICVVPYDKYFYMSKIKNYFSNRKIGEYLAAGKPIIISDIEGISSYLQKDVNCLLYESGNPSDLAKKVNKLLNDDVLYRTMAKNNKILAKKMSWDYLMKQSSIINKIYNSK